MRFPSLRLHTSRGRYRTPSKCTSRVYLCSCVLHACVFVFASALRWHPLVRFALAEAPPFGVSVHRYNQYANQCDAAAGVDMGGEQLLDSKPLSLGSSDEQEVFACQTGTICMREGCAQTLGGPLCLGAPCSGQLPFPDLTMVDFPENSSLTLILSKHFSFNLC